MKKNNKTEASNEKWTKMPHGAYFDENGMLKDANGELLPDGAYQEEDGSITMYEGNFLKALEDNS